VADGQMSAQASKMRCANRFFTKICLWKL